VYFPFFLRTTGVQPGGDPLGILGFKASTIPLLALPMDMLLFGIVLWLTWVWSESVKSGTWAERISIFHFERDDADPRSRGGRIYQRWNLALALVAPLLPTLQMAGRFFGGIDYEQGKNPELASGWELFEFGRLVAATGPLRFGDPQGPEFFAWQPWLFALCLIALLLAWLGTLRSVSR